MDSRIGQDMIASEISQNKQVLSIQVDSVIISPEGETQEMTLYTEATYKVERNKQYLMYDETEISGMDGTKTLLSYDGTSVHIRRYGDVKSNLKIQLQESFENFYTTPYGTFIMTTYGESFKWDENRIDIELCYQLTIEGDHELPSTVRIKIRQLNTSLLEE